MIATLYWRPVLGCIQFAVITPGAVFAKLRSIGISLLSILGLFRVSAAIAALCHDAILRDPAGVGCYPRNRDWRSQRVPGT
jgi:hypothetical protein